MTSKDIVDLLLELCDKVAHEGVVDLGAADGSVAHCAKNVVHSTSHSNQSSLSLVRQSRLSSHPAKAATKRAMSLSYFALSGVVYQHVGVVALLAILPHIIGKQCCDRLLNQSDVLETSCACSSPDPA